MANAGRDDQLGMFRSYVMPGVTVDGNDPDAVFDAMTTAVARARAGEGPTLVEAATFRFCGHLVGDDSSYMPPGLFTERMAADPYPAYRTRLAAAGVAEAELAAIEAAAADEVADAVEFALASPLPDEAELDVDVFAPVTVGVPA